MTHARAAWFALILSACLALAGAVEKAAAGSILLNPAVTYQTMTGWEATAWASQDSPAFGNFRDTLFDLAVNQVGINRLRLELRSGAENSEDYWTQYQNGTIDYATWRSVRYSTINDNDDPNAINWTGFHFSELDDVITRIITPFKQRVEANGEHLYINLNYVAFTSQIGAGLLYHHDDPEEYAEFILAAMLHIRDTYGWAPDAVEVILEPDNVSQWNATLIGQAMAATGAKLAANGFTPRFIAPSNTSMSNAVTYFDQMIQVPGALQYLVELSYHRYAGVSDTSLQAIAARAQQHGIGAGMLEWWSGSNGYQTLHQDLKMGRNSAWQQAVISGHFDINDTDPEHPAVAINAATQFTRLYFRFVRSGAVRIEATSDDGNLDPLAFINADGRYVVIVKAAAGGSLTVQGLPVATYSITYTTAAESAVDLPDQTIASGEALITAIPAAGVITIHAKQTGGFPDVPPGHWAYAEIMACAAAGIVSGYPDGTYRPAVPVTRDQMSVFIARGLVAPSGDAGIPTGPAEATFSDVPADYWAYKWVEYAVDQSIVGGYGDGTYRPTVQVDRGQMAVFIARAIVTPHGDEGLVGYTPPVTPTFSDVATDHWAYTHIEYIAQDSVAVSQGYPDGTYRPAVIVTRDQMAVYVQRAFELPL